MSDLGPQAGPIDPDMHEFMNTLARELDLRFNGGVGAAVSAKPVGFFLAAYRMGEPGRFNYISNSEKLDVRAMLKEIVARIEGRLTREGHA